MDFAKCPVLIVSSAPNGKPSDLFLFICFLDRTKVFAPLKWLVEGCLHAFVELEHGILECARFFQRVPVENMVKIFMFIETSALFVEDLIDAAV